MVVLARRMIGIGAALRMLRIVVSECTLGPLPACVLPIGDVDIDAHWVWPSQRGPSTAWG